jgi:hypothetical protein
MSEGFPRSALALDERVVPIVGAYWCRTHGHLAWQECHTRYAGCELVTLCIIETGRGRRKPAAKSGGQGAAEG